MNGLMIKKKADCSHRFSGVVDIVAMTTVILPALDMAAIFELVRPISVENIIKGFKREVLLFS